MKIWQESKAKYEATERISLVSSFLASVLIGQYAPIDCSDAAGMESWSLYRLIFLSPLNDRHEPLGHSPKEMGSRGLGTCSPRSRRQAWFSLRFAHHRWLHCCVLSQALRLL